MTSRARTTAPQRTKFAATELPNSFVKTKKLLEKPDESDFWEDLLEEGVIDPEDLSETSSGFGIEIVNVSADDSHVYVEGTES